MKVLIVVADSIASMEACKTVSDSGHEAVSCEDVDNAVLEIRFGTVLDAVIVDFDMQDSARVSETANHYCIQMMLITERPSDVPNSCRAKVVDKQDFGADVISSWLAEVLD